LQKLEGVNRGKNIRTAPNNATGADGVKIAVLRKCRASLEFISAAAHRRTLAYQDDETKHSNIGSSRTCRGYRLALGA
jgi:hypothetical protein